jgi:hypothetical protein
MRSPAAAISVKTGNMCDSAVHTSVDADSRGNGEISEPRAQASVEEPERLLKERLLKERLLKERPLEELERLLREHSLGSATYVPSECPYCPKRGSMEDQEYLEFVVILEDTRTRIETVLTELPVNGATKARLNRVVANLERAAQRFRKKDKASLT